jgi:hypothetical protein
MLNMVRINNRRLWIGIAACTAAGIALLWWFYAPMPRHNSNESTARAAEDEVDATVVRDMTTPADVEAQVTLLVFSDELLSDHKAGTDTEACKEDVRNRVRWDVDALPYDSLFDKVYRFLTRSRVYGSLRTETVEDFLEKSCSGGHLSRTFHTDSPRSFVSTANVPFDKNGPSTFEKKFPGARGIISLSRVGLDSGLDEAIVSSSLNCGFLCAEGWRYILKKRHGKWEVASKRMVWVS